MSLERWGDIAGRGGNGRGAEYGPRRPFSSPYNGQSAPMSGGRVPPHNIEAEMAVLGAMLLGDRGAIERVTEILARDDFYRDAHAHLFDAMVSLTEKDEPVDVVTLKDELHRRGVLEGIGGIAYVTQLADISFTTANIIYYAKIVQEKGLLRRLIDAASQIAGLAYGEVEEASEMVDKAERTIFEVARRRDNKSLAPLRPLLNEAFDKISDTYHEKGLVSGVDTGFDQLNYITSGLQDGDLFILAARPSMGKCLIASSLVDNPLTGERVTLETYVKQRLPLVASLSACGCVRPAAISHWIDSGIKPVWTVTTRTGRRVTVTGHHPFLTVSGWTPLHDLRVGDEIGVPHALPVFGSDTSLSLEYVRLLGERGQKRPRFSARAWQWDKPRLAEFLRGLLPATSFVTRHEIFARNLQHALVRFGVVAHLEHRSEQWHVEINEPLSKEIFGREIIGEKNDAVPCGAGEPRNDIYWDEIVSIESAGEQQVYDLTVPEGANFIADDVCVHNTSLAIGIGQNACLRAGKSVAVFSLEMSKEQLVQRMICSEARIDAHRLRTGYLDDSDWGKISEAVNRLWEANLFIDDSTDMSALEMRAKCRRLRAEHGLDLVIVDYLQLMRGGGREGNRNEEITTISRGLKSLARELKVPVIALAQLSRAVERREDKRPMLSDLRDSGSIEAEADVVGFIYRPAYYERKEAIAEDSEAKLVEGNSRPGEYEGEEAEVIIAKQRNGPTGTVKLSFLPKFARFDNLEMGREESPF